MFITWAERQTDKQLKNLQSGGGEEYVDKDFATCVKEGGTYHRMSCSHTSQQNRLAERMNQVLLEMTRARLKHHTTRKLFWADAIVTGAYT